MVLPSPDKEGGEEQGDTDFRYSPFQGGPGEFSSQNIPSRSKGRRKKGKGISICFY